MIPYLGDFAEDETVYMYFNTFDSNDPSASVTITNLADADIFVYKDGSVTDIVTDGATVTIDFDSRTGLHKIEIDTAAHADYAVGSDYMVMVNGVTVDAATLNSAIACFSIENRHSAGALRPTTAGRTLDVTATGAAGIDWGNVENKTTANDLSGTDIQLADTTTTVTNQHTLAAINAEVDTALTDIHLDHLMAAAAADVVVDGSVIAHMVSTTEDWSTFVPSTDALQAIRDRGDSAWATGGGSGLTALTSGTAQSGTASTMVLAASAAFADNVLNGNVVNIHTGTGAGQSRLIISNTLSDDTINITPDWATNPSSDSQYEIVQGSVNIASISLDATAANNLELDYDGTGYAKTNSTVGLLTATQASIDAIETDTTTDIPALIATAQADLDAITDTDGVILGAAGVDLIWDEALSGHQTAGTAGRNLTFAGTILAETTLTGTPTASTMQLTAGSTSDDFYNDMELLIIDGTYAGLSRIIEDYTGSTKLVTFDEALIGAPSSGDAVVIRANHKHPKSQIADAIWDETMAGHTTSDTAGLVMNEWQDAGRLDAILDTIATDTTTDIPALIATAQADLDTITDTDGVILGAAGVDKIWDEDVVAAHTTVDTAGHILSKTTSIISGAGGVSQQMTSFTKTVGGTETNSETDTVALDGVLHIVPETTAEIDIYYEFAVGVTGVVTEIVWDGYATTNNDVVEVYGWDWQAGPAAWVQIGSVEGGSANVTEYGFIPYADMTGTGANAGTFRLRFHSDGVDNATNIATDRILAEYTALPEAGVVLHSGVAQAGTSNTIQLDTSANAIDDFYNHARVVISSGTGAEQERLIVDYTGSTKTATVAPPWITSPDSTSAFEVEPGLSHAETGWGTIKVGLAAAGASTTITLDSNASATNDYYNNDIIFIDAGTGEGQVRIITDYDGATKEATVHTAWGTTPDTTSEYIVETGHPYIDGQLTTRTPSSAELAYIVDNSATGYPIVFTTSGGSTTAAVFNTIDGSTPEANTDHYKGRLIVFTSGTLKGVVTDITAYTQATKTATITAIPFAPTASHTARLI